MTKTPKGWELPLYLADGTHLYQFFAEGKGYPDPKNNNMIANDFGKMSSIVLIGKPDDLYLAFHSYRETVARDKEDKNKLADFYVHIGYIHLRTSHYTLACQSFQKALSLYQQLQNQDSTASMLFRIAITYKRLLDFPHQLEYLQKSFTAYEKAGNKYGMATVQKELGYYYADLPATPKAIEYFHKSLSLFEQLGKQIEVGQLLGNLGHMYLFMHDSAKSISYLQKALKLNQQLGNKKAVGFNFWILGDYYFRLSFNISAAIDYLQKAQDVFEQLGDRGGVAYILFNLADILLYAPDSALEKAQIKISEKYIRSIEYQKRGIEMMKDIHPEHLQVIHFRVLSETYEKIGLNDSAYHYYKQYIMRRDKVVDIEKQKAIVRLETRFENEKREDSLKLDKQLTDEKLQNQILLARQQQDLQQLAYLKTQAELQNEQLTSREKEKQLTLSEKEKQLQAAKVKTLTQAQAIAKLNQQRQWIYFGGVFLLLTLASVYFIYRWRVRSIRLESQLVKEKSEQQQKESEFQHKLADISLSALRSQMNPHFIFNCLNSIKLYTIQNDTTAATAYLSKFSKLIRLVLENSRSERITLRSELAALELYIQMEAMRFKEKLSYRINVKEDVETDYIELPPLLLQPYVENAIWHGLMHKEEGGHIEINASMQNEGSLLEINIADNGIGRVMAAQLKSKKVKNHNSYGMKATSERIALINQIYKTGAKVMINDLVDHEGKPAGTQVTIQLPV